MEETGIQPGFHVQKDGRCHGLASSMPCHGLLLIAFALIVYVVVIWGGIPPLWPYRDHPLVRVLLAFLTGGHPEELFQETGAWL